MLTAFISAWCAGFCLGDHTGGDGILSGVDYTLILSGFYLSRTHTRGLSGVDHE